MIPGGRIFFFSFGSWSVKGYRVASERACVCGWDKPLAFGLSYVRNVILLEIAQVTRSSTYIYRYYLGIWFPLYRNGANIAEVNPIPIQELDLIERSTLPFSRRRIWPNWTWSKRKRDSRRPLAQDFNSVSIFPVNKVQSTFQISFTLHFFGFGFPHFVEIYFWFIILKF